MTRFPTVPAAVAAAIVSAVLASLRRTACAGRRRAAGPAARRGRPRSHAARTTWPQEDRDPSGPAELVPLLAGEHRARRPDEHGAGVARGFGEPVPRAGPRTRVRRGAGRAGRPVELVEQRRGWYRRPPAVGLQAVQDGHQLVAAERTLSSERGSP